MRVPESDRKPGVMPDEGVKRTVEGSKSLVTEEKELEKLRGLLVRAPANNYESREWPNGSGYIYIDRKDVVTLLFPESGEKKNGTQFELLKQKGKIKAGDTSIVFEADSTAAQIAKLIHKKRGQEPEKIYWNRT
jgi:hypothetical protein